MAETGKIELFPEIYYKGVFNAFLASYVNCNGKINEDIGLELSVSWHDPQNLQCMFSWVAGYKPSKVPGPTPSDDTVEDISGWKLLFQNGTDLAKLEMSFIKILDSIIT